MATIKEQIEMIRAEIDKTQKNKATNAHIGKLKAKIAQLKIKEEKTAAHSKASGGGKGFEVRKSGDATVALVGFPSVGKSTLISKVTDAHSEAGGYAFTTLTCIPGVMEHRGAKIQILDLPGLIKGAAEGKGRGREILNVIRSADMVLYIVDPFQDGHFNVLHRELHNAGLRLNEVKPPVFIKRTERGGIEVRSTVEQTHLTEEEMADIIRSFGYTSALVTLREDSTAEQIVDALAGNRVYEKAVIAINKIDIATEHDIARARSALPQEWPIMNISAFKDIGLEELKDFIYDNLGFMRVFLKPQGQEADMEKREVIVKDDSTVENICVSCTEISSGNFALARIRGPSAKFDDQRVGLDHQLKDGCCSCMGRTPSSSSDDSELGPFAASVPLHDLNTLANTRETHLKWTEMNNKRWTRGKDMDGVSESKPLILFNTHVYPSVWRYKEGPCCSKSIIEYNELSLCTKWRRFVPSFAIANRWLWLSSSRTACTRTPWDQLMETMRDGVEIRRFQYAREDKVFKTLAYRGDMHKQVKRSISKAMLFFSFLRKPPTRWEKSQWTKTHQRIVQHACYPPSSTHTG